VTKSKSSKIHCLTSDQSDWTKIHTTNTKLSTKRNQIHIKNEKRVKGFIHCHPDSYV
jgi:hypothetical protein